MTSSLLFEFFEGLVEAGWGEVGGIVSEREQRLAAIAVFAAPKGGFALHDVALATHGAHNLVVRLDARCTRFFLASGDVFPFLLRFLFIGVFHYDAGAGVVAQHIEHNFAHHGLEFFNKLLGAELAALNLAQFVFPESGEFCRLEEFFVNDVDELLSFRNNHVNTSVHFHPSLR